MGISAKWREKEPSLKEVIRQNPDVPPIIILKIDVLRRGVTYTKAAIDAVDPKVHITELRHIFAEKRDNTPVSLILRDGSSILTSISVKVQTRDPYTVDVVNEKTVLVDNDEVIEEVEYWRRPDYYDKFTSKGTPMWQIIAARPQRLDVIPNHHCHFWNKPGNGCKYCNAGASYNSTKGCRPTTLDPVEVSETIKEALKQKGRYSSIMLTGGSILDGKELFDEEVDLYIDIIQALGEGFKTRRFPSQLISSAFNEKQLQKIYDNTGLMNYTSDLEVINEDKFNWICPGKAEYVGYQEWKNRLYKAVEIFGKGNVNTGLVSGVEMATPGGFATEAEALKALLEEADELASHGVSVAGGIWNVTEGSIFHNQTAPSLDYLVKLVKGYDAARRKYNIQPYMDDYRRCGTHPSTDLGRV
jgi:hypothetical protein